VPCGGAHQAATTRTPSSFSSDMAMPKAKLFDRRSTAQQNTLSWGASSASRQQEEQPDGQQQRGEQQKQQVEQEQGEQQQEVERWGEAQIKIHFPEHARMVKEEQEVKEEQQGVKEEQEVKEEQQEEKEEAAAEDEAMHHAEEGEAKREVKEQKEEQEAKEEAKQEVKEEAKQEEQEAKEQAKQEATEEVKQEEKGEAKGRKRKQEEDVAENSPALKMERAAEETQPTLSQGGLDRPAALVGDGDGISVLSDHVGSPVSETPPNPDEDIEDASTIGDFSEDHFWASGIYGRCF